MPDYVQPVPSLYQYQQAYAQQQSQAAYLYQQQYYGAQAQQQYVYAQQQQQQQQGAPSGGAQVPSSGSATSQAPTASYPQASGYAANGGAAGAGGPQPQVILSDTSILMNFKVFSLTLWVRLEGRRMPRGPPLRSLQQPLCCPTPPQVCFFLLSVSD